MKDAGAKADDPHSTAESPLPRGVDTVVLKPTGLPPVPVPEVLEQRGVAVQLVNPRQMKYPRGCKCHLQKLPAWLEKRMSPGAVDHQKQSASALGEVYRRL